MSGAGYQWLISRFGRVHACRPALQRDRSRAHHHEAETDRTAPPVRGEPVLASSPGTQSTPPTPAGVVGVIVDGETPVDVGVVVAGAVVGGAVVGGEVVFVVPQSLGRSTVAVTVFVNSSARCATTVIVISLLTPPGTSVVAAVLEAAGTGFVATSTPYVTPDATETR